MAPRLASRPSPVALTTLLSLAACTVGPDYEGPPTDGVTVPENFGPVDDPAFQVGATDITQWWTVFGDPELEALIDRAASDNRDLRIALSRVGEARARVGSVRAAGRPQVGIGGGVQATNNFFTGFETRAVSSAGIDASWELDVFGRIARQVEAAEAQFEASDEDRRDVQVSLFAEVARAYLNVRSLQEQLEAAQENLTSQREIQRLTETRFVDGIASRLDVSQANQVLAESESLVPPLRIALATEINALAVLIGTNPQELHAELREPKPLPLPEVDQIIIGVPADLLRQRPDIRAAERRLAAQTALKGVAVADYYPSFSISGTLGFQNFGSGDLFDAGSRNFSLGPALRWQLFDGGRRDAQVEIADAQIEQAALIYERTLLSAMEEVESAMIAFTEQRVRVGALERSKAAADESLGLAVKLYEQGLVGFQQVLDSQRSAFAANGNLAEARGLATQNLVRLYKSLGGGWDPETDIIPLDADDTADRGDGDAATGT